VVVMVADRTAWTDEDSWVQEQVRASGAPAILVLNKVDLLSDKAVLLPRLQELGAGGEFKAILPISALNQHNVAELEACISQQLPWGKHFFPEDQITDRSQRFLAAEIVREKITRQLGDELPYAVTVEIEEFKEKGPTLHISAIIFVERKGQKRILIGQAGARMRSIGSEARRDMETMFDRKIMLRLWVKVKSGWSDDERALRSLGYDD